MFVDRIQLGVPTANACKCHDCQAARDGDMLIIPTMTWEDVTAGLAGQTADEVRDERNRRLQVFASSDPDLLPLPTMDWSR